MWDILGQERAVAAVAASLASPRPPHAYLFVGPASVGKHRLALQLAQALNCGAQGPPSAGSGQGPCGQCRPCQRIAAGLHADVQSVGLESGEGGPHKEIRIAQIREVERAVALKPYEGRSRVIIIDPADALNIEAQNAFLKTLEEPPPQVVFVLVTTREAALLPTIRSRCQRVELRLLPLAVIEEALRHRYSLEGEKAHLLARLSQGRIGWAIAVAQDPSLLAQREEALATARQMPLLPLSQRFQLAEGLAARFYRDRQQVLETLELWRGWWRDILLVQAAAAEGVTNVDLAEALAGEAHRYDAPAVAAFLRAMAAVKAQLEDNVNPRLALEALMLEAPSGHSR